MSTLLVYTNAVTQRVLQSNRCCSLPQTHLVLPRVIAHQIRYIHNISPRLHPQDEDVRSTTPLGNKNSRSKAPLIPPPIHLKQTVLTHTPVSLYISQVGLIRKRLMNSDILKSRSPQLFCPADQLPMHYRYGFELYPTSSSFIDSVMYHLLASKRLHEGIPLSHESDGSSALKGYRGKSKSQLLTPQRSTNKNVREGIVRVLEVPKGTPIPEKLMLNEWELDGVTLYALTGSKLMNSKEVAAHILAFLREYRISLSPKEYADKISTPEMESERTEFEHFVEAAKEYEPRYRKKMTKAKLKYAKSV